MNIIPVETYHIYNQGNNHEKIFHVDKDYLHFLELFRKLVLPNCEVFAYCLMPNHFHFLIHTTEVSARTKRVGNIESCELANGFRLLQGNYAQYVNKKYNRSGSLFRQRTKAKPLSDGNLNYGFIAFHYIHQNPIISKLVARLEDWKYSSFPDYAGLRNGTICNKDLAFRIIDINPKNFIEESYRMINSEKIQKLY